jgi:hypothetical protein
MSCCGRRPATGGTMPMTRPIPAAGPAAGGRLSYVPFEYVGRTAMTVVGRASGRTYRFDGPGAVVAVDPADRASLAAVPGLRRISGTI